MRVKGTHDLSNLSGTLVTSFNAGRLAQLQTEYAAGGGEAPSVLAAFMRAADNHRTAETEFNRRAKPAGPNLMTNLRSDLGILRTFTDARQSLIETNPRVGTMIAKLVETDITSPARSRVSPAKAPARNLDRTLS